jgi:hypothetical protein
MLKVLQSSFRTLLAHLRCLCSCFFLPCSAVLCCALLCCVSQLLSALHQQVANLPDGTELPPSTTGAEESLMSFISKHKLLAPLSQYDFWHSRRFFRCSL